VGEPKKCIAISDAIDETIVFAVQLADRAILGSPALLRRAVESDAFRKGLTDALLTYAKKRVKDAPVQFSPEETRDFTEKLLNAGVDGLKGNVEDQLRKSWQYRGLRRSAEQIADSLKCSPAGIWVDKNEGVIYVVGGGLVLGGLVGMYVTRSGDGVASTAMPALKQLKPKIKVIGLELEANLRSFVPSKCQIELDLQAAGKWEAIEAELKINVQAVSDKVQLKSDGTVVLPFKSGFVKLEASHDTRTPSIISTSLGLGLQLQPGGLRTSVLGRVNLRNLQPNGGSLDLRVSPSRQSPFTFGATSTLDEGKTSVLFNLEVGF